MGEVLWEKFLEEMIDDLQLSLIAVGIHGILNEYGFWLRRKVYLDK